MRLAHFVAMTALVLPFGLRGQTPKQPAATQDLELNLEARDTVRGVPTTFHIILRNVGKQDIRLPEPSLGCPSAVDGSVLLVERYKLQIPSDAIGFGCTAGRPYTQDILKRAKSWVLLRPGGYLERVASPAACTMKITARETTTFRPNTRRRSLHRLSAAHSTMLPLFTRRRNWSAGMWC